MKSISSILVIILASLACIGHVNSACFDLTKQYFECSILNMTLVDEGWRQYYIPDPNVENNYIDNWVYEWYLGDSDLSDSLDAMKSLNQLIADCEGEKCECVKQRRRINWSSDETFAVFFETDENYEDVKNIISSLDSALADTRLSAEELQNVWGFSSEDANLTSLSQFCAKAEYTGVRAYEYRDFDSCWNFNDGLYYACDYYKQVDSENREAFIGENDESNERNLVCQILGYRNCAYEQQLFKSLILWAEWYNRPSLSNERLGTYLEGLVAAAGNFDTENVYNSMYMSIYQESISYKASNPGYGQTTLETIGNPISLLSSDILDIDSEIEINSDGESSISTLTIKIKDEAGGENRLDLDLSDSNLQNITLTNNDGVNLAQIVSFQYDNFNYMYIYDFNSQSIIYYYKSFLLLLAPQSLFDQSIGLLANGAPQNYTESSSEEENKMACKEMCNNISKSLKAVNLPKHISYSKESERCMESC